MEQSKRVHRCRTGASPSQRKWADPQFRPMWGKPGELTKLVDQERWGRVILLYTCCGEREVDVQPFGGDEGGVLRCWITDLEDPWEAYPANLPPRGYPVRTRSGRVMAFPGNGRNKDADRRVDSVR